MTTGHKVSQRWNGTIRFRIAEEPGVVGLTPDVIFYDWHLAFAYGNTREELITDLKRKLDELEANGRIIGGSGDPITIECVTTKRVTRTREEFMMEVKPDAS